MPNNTELEKCIRDIYIRYSTASSQFEDFLLLPNTTLSELTVDDNKNTSTLRSLKCYIKLLKTFPFTIKNTYQTTNALSHSLKTLLKCKEFP